MKLLLLVAACGPGRGDPSPPGGPDLGSAAPDAAPPAAPPALIERSLFYRDPALLDAADGPTLARTLAAISPDGHGGRMLAAWFRRFATTAHSERAGPAQLIEEIAGRQGADPARWDLAALPFTPTGIHNRIDLADLVTPGAGHCGELRISYASTHPIYQPMHLLFIFRQPADADAGDVELRGGVPVTTCAGTARRWLALSAPALDPGAFAAARRAVVTAGLVRERFLLAETVEFTVSPWEWRQWFPAADPEVGLVLDNRPLFQTAEPGALNPAGPLREAFLAWVARRAATLDTRREPIPEEFRRPSTRVVQGVPRPTLSLAGLDATTSARYPRLRQQIEIAGCPACHTSDADFVQTRADRSISPFYEKELEARRVHLDALGRGDAPTAPFGPLQPNPVLPP